MANDPKNLPTEEKFRRIVADLQANANAHNIAGMARFGIVSDKAYGVTTPHMRRLAATYGRDRKLAAMLWEEGSIEARIIASIVDDPAAVDDKQLESWAADLDNWAVCDQCCMNLFAHSPLALKKVFEWSEREEPYVKRCAFVIIARFSVHEKKAGDDFFEQFFPLIVREANDDRVPVKKAVNWALRQIGKRNIRLNRRAVEVGGQVRALGSRSARWISSDALRELNSPAVVGRLEEKEVVTGYGQ